VEHRAKAWSDALPGWHFDRAEGTSTGEAAGRRRLDRNPVSEVLPTGAVVEREAMERPRVLRVDPDVLVQLVAPFPRRVEHIDPGGNAVREECTEVAVCEVG